VTVVEIAGRHQGQGLERRGGVKFSGELGGGVGVSSGVAGGYRGGVMIDLAGFWTPNQLTGEGNS